LFGFSFSIVSHFSAMFIFNHRYFLFLTGKSCLPMADNVLEP